MNEDSPLPENQETQRRNRSISSAVATSLASKVGTVILQFVSIPIAYHKLGEEDFGLYSTIAVSISTLILFQIGIGPALTHGISRASSTGNKILEKQYFSTSWFLLAALGTLGGLLATLALTFVPITFFLGEKYIGLEDKLLPGLWLALVIILIEFILSHTERAREGLLQSHLNNIFGAAGNILGALAVGIGIHFFNSIEFLVLAVFGTRAIVRVANTAYLFWQRPELFPRLSFFKPLLALEMLSDGLAFTVSHSLTGFVEVNLCGWLVARHLGPVAVGHFQILTQLATLLLGMIIMFTTPIWPAVVDAFTRKDTPWIRRIATKVQAGVALYGLAIIIFLPTIGPFALSIIFKGLELSWILLLPFAFHFTTSAWAHATSSLLIGVGQVRRVAIISLVETVVLFGISWLGLSLFGLPGLFAGMAFVTAAISCWMFPVALKRKIHEEPAQATAATTP